MKLFRSEKGITKIHLVIVVVVIMMIVAFSMLLAIGEDGFSLKTKNEINNSVQQDETKNNEQKNQIIDNTVYRN